MNSYIFAIITISIVGGITTSLIPPNNIRIKKHLNLVISLIFLIILIAPIKKTIDKTSIIKENIDSFIESINSNVEYTNNLIVNTSIDKISLGIKEAIVNEFNFKDDYLKIVIDYNKDNIEAIQIIKVEIYLFNEATWSDESKIQEFIEKLINCDVKIIKK